MQKTPLIIVVGTLLAVPLLGSAAPAPGCADLNLPGNWTNLFADFYYGFWMDDGLTYRIRQTWTSSYGSDSTGQWDLIQLYNGSQISLSNAPGAPWYPASDTNLSFEIDLPALWVKSRSRSGPATNACMEMEVSAHAGRFIFLASYAGTAAITNVPETPDTIAYTLKSAPLSSARFCLGYLPGDPGFPTNARPRLSIRGLPLAAPQVELQWNSLSNGLYQVQFRPELDSGDWADLGNSLIGTGTSWSAVDPITPEAAQRFYRVLEFP